MACKDVEAREGEAVSTGRNRNRNREGDNESNMQDMFTFLDTDEPAATR